jgi:hypothetical protein
MTPAPNINSLRLFEGTSQFDNLLIQFINAVQRPISATFFPVMINGVISTEK